MSKKKKKIYSNEVVTPICKSATYYFEDTKEVIKYHKDTIKVLHYLRPIGVAMAGEDIYDPYID